MKRYLYKRKEDVMKKKRFLTAIAVACSLVLSLASPKVASAVFIGDEAQDALNRIGARI